MQDSNITYTVKTAGIEEAQAKMNALGATITKMTMNANGTVTASGKLTSTLQAQTGATNQAAAATDKASKSQASYFGHIAKTTVQSALINKLFLELVDVSGQAIKQVDLMNNFPATMASMGQSTKDSTEAFKALTNYVGMIGGNLGDAASAVTRFTGVTKDVKSAVAIFTGLNNALVAGDSTMEEQRLAAIQFAQAFERGKPDMKEWLSLTQNMSQQLGIVAKSMGYVNANALGEALRNGDESMGAFTAKLTELSTGTGPIAQQALARMNGMQFAFNVMKNTMVQGLAAIINAFGRTNIVSFFTFLTQVIQVTAQAVVFLINAFWSLVNAVRGLFGLSPLQGMAKDATSAANATGGIGDNLDDAKGKAKELQKSLAGFDKMNVIEKGKDKKDDGPGNGTEFDAGQMGKLSEAFGNIGTKLQEASLWAKIFAGALGAIVATLTTLRGIEAFNKTLDNIKTFKSNLDDVNKKLGEMGDKAKTNFGKVGDGIKNSGLGKGVSSMSTAIAGFVGGVAGAIGSALGPALAGAATAVVGTISGILAAGAAALGVSVGVFVLIIAAAIAAIVAIIWLIWTNWDTIWKFITDVFTAAWNGIVAAWNTLYDIFKGPVEWIWQFISATFILIVAIIAIALESIFKAVVWVVQQIFGVLATIGMWIYDNVIKPVVDFFVEMWNKIIKIITDAWNWIFSNVLAPIGNWIMTNVINPVANFFKGLWDKVSGFVVGFVSGFYNIIRPVVDWISRNVVEPIGRFFEGLWNGIKTGLSNMIEGLKSLFGGIANVFKTPINGIIDLVNKALGGMNGLKVPDWVPGIGGSKVNFPQIPKLARGGIVDQATMAMIGEDGKEAVVPLENNTEWIDTLAAKINGATGGSNQPIHVTIQIGEDKIATKVIDLINEKTHMSGRNTILV